LIPSREDTKENSISLVVSFWAENEDRQQNPHAHRQEVEAAMLTNLQNPHLDQLVVVLDSVSEGTTNCQTFIDHMAQRFHNITQGVLPSQSGQFPRLSKLACIERRQGQPNYFEMFHYATYHSTVTSNIVMMSNADQVFDDTLLHVKPMSKDTIFVLSTRGYEAVRVPTNIRNFYLSLVGDDGADNPEAYKRNGTNFATQDYCVNNKKVGEPETLYSGSWDTYIFYRSLLRTTLPMNSTKENYFTRMNFHREPEVYYMNQLSAEQAALYDITHSLQKKVTVWNACSLIRTWHFHLAPKMHHNDDIPNWPIHSDVMGGGYVYYEDYGPYVPSPLKRLKATKREPNIPRKYLPPPFAFAPLCFGIKECHSDNFHSGIFLHSEPHVDATTTVQLNRSTVPDGGEKRR